MINVIVINNKGISAMTEDLNYLSRQELIQLWKRVFKKNSPMHARKEFLIKHINWELQERKSGESSTRMLKKIDELSEKLSKSNNSSQDEVKLIQKSSELEIKPGTKLIREYKREKHEVIALDQGFQYNNKIYKSLSAIANEITGTRWNGKVFFGVKK